MAGTRGSGVAGLTVEQRLWRISEVVGECWEWQGFRNPDGYGRINIGGRLQLVHRAAYELFVGPISEGLTIDHLCRNRACWRPEHLEAVDPKVNIMRGYGIGAVNRRKMQCKRGHRLEGENVWRYGGRRYCRACRKDYHREYMRTYRAKRAGRRGE